MIESESRLIRVLVVDDSALCRRTLSDIIDSSGFARVVSVARDGEEALKRVFEVRPDLVTLDLEMPHMDGFTFLRILMKSLPTPVLVVSSLHEDKNVFKALELGAVDFLARPTDHDKHQEALQRDLVFKLKLVTELRMRNIQRRLSQQEGQRWFETLPRPKPQAAPRPFGVELIAIGASTGGPSALQNILWSLPSGLQSAIVISQHMPAGFTRAFAERLNRNCALDIREAQTGDKVEQGKVLLAPGGYNLGLKKRKNAVVVEAEERKPVDKYVPSIDKLFHSAAGIYGERMLAVVLTGMGSDGKAGISAVKKAGGHTMAESEQSCIVYGMPREAISTRQVDEVFPLEEIPSAILRLCNVKGPVKEEKH
jgi:two-component system chemotaxis response regulator CheB